MTDKEFHKVLSLGNHGGDRRVVLHVKDRHLSQGNKEEKLHSIRVSRKPHLKEFKEQLHRRSEQVKEIIEEEYDKFEDMEQVQRDIEARELRQREKEEQRKEKKFQKLKKLK